MLLHIILVGFHVACSAFDITLYNQLFRNFLYTLYLFANKTDGTFANIISYFVTHNTRVTLPSASASIYIDILYLVSCVAFSSLFL